MLLNNFTLLYVEDNEETQRQMKMLLEDDVKEFYQAYDGREGVELYKEKSPDIILTDVNMPVLDGLCMAEEIKKMDKEQPIIVMSTFDDRKTLLKAINIGIDGFTTKPIDIDILNNQLGVTAQNLQNKIDARNAKIKQISDLYSLAHYDALTNVPNRLLFDLRLEQALSKAKRHNGKLTLFFIDLDNFKTINDMYGHQAGDIVLETVAKNVKNSIRGEDTVARIGGDEFSVIIEGTADKNYLNVLAQKIIKAVSKPIKYKDNTIDVSCSVGISRYPQDCATKDELIEFADSAMYKAKNTDKCNFLYYIDKKG